MIRKVIKIDRDKCDGCGLCVAACHEAAIGLADGKAVLLRDDYCDGLGDCLPVCPMEAITFEEREASPYDEKAVKENMEKKRQATKVDPTPLPCGCPGQHAKAIEHRQTKAPVPARAEAAAVSQLNQWPVQIKLAPANAPYFDGANLLISADCAAYAYGNFHQEFMKNKITLIGCPKLDAVDYGEKLTAIIGANNIKSVTVARMEVPCCGGIEHAVIAALKNSGKMIPWQVVTISTDGEILD